MGTLYVVGTPIGNLEDISQRALRTLREASLIAAEDTRSARRLITHHQIGTPLTSYWEHNKLTKLQAILASLDDGDVALISEAGMPGLSDPGYELIRAAIDGGHRIGVVPGPTALVSALVVSGLPTDRFQYVGFLPRRSGARRRLLAQLASYRHTILAFEAPHRLIQSLEDVELVMGDRQMAIAREMTKTHEEIWRGRVNHARRHFSACPPRGEFTLVVAGNTDPESHWEQEKVRASLSQLLEAGVRRREAVKAVAEMGGWPQQKVYQLSLMRERSHE